MLFNSYPFLFAYLPLTILGFFFAGRFGKAAGAAWLAACSLFFYAWWDWRYLELLLTSICGNYLAGKYIMRHALRAAGRRALIVAVGANLALLAYYKYADFFLSSANTLIGTDWPILHIVLPIGISFFTFTQIAFLVDAYSGNIAGYRFIQYILFVTYFPHLIAGPVLHHKEMMPQFDEERNYHPDAANFAIGLTIFAIGLAKKVLIADSLAIYANPVFDPHASAPTLFIAWGGALAYTFQLYFDFSGYSDMAIGLSMLFGVRLPLNFDSPYKSRNIAEFWRRWHMTLSRFLRDYLYIPLGGNRHGAFRRQSNLMITMLLGGLWHGAGWNFVIWGGLHGCYLITHQIWQILRRRIPLKLPPGVGAFLATGITFVSVVFAWVYFRAPDLAAANRIVIGMMGGWGATLPESILSRTGLPAQLLQTLGVSSHLGGGSTFIETWCWIAAAAAIVFLTPNTQEIMARFEPALQDAIPPSLRPASRLAWAPCRSHAAIMGLLLALGALALSSPTHFLYFQF